MSTKTISYLHTTALSVGYTSNKTENRLFENLNLALPAGRLVCFMGPNGIGKSSLIRTLAGLQKPLAGSIQITHDDNDNSTSQQVAVVLTDKVSTLNLSVYDVVAFGRYPYLDWSIRLRENDLRIIDQAIAQVNIKYLSGQKLHALSDGQLQMVMIARALAQDTPIILLDEPTAHLDLNNRVEIMRLLRNLAHTTNKAILVATHDLDLTLQMADWIWLTGNNKNILTGIPEDLVLDGSLDTIFQFKGFDLKTGKVQHESHKRINVHLSGTGPEYLWTRNALERNGFSITEEACDIAVSLIITPSGTIQWTLQKHSRQTQVSSLAALLGEL
jgi:iron complex transport system ATP-binding protein